MGHLNGILAWVEGNLNNNFQKSQIPGGLPGGMLKLRFDRYISERKFAPVNQREKIQTYRKMILLRTSLRRVSVVMSPIWSLEKAPLQRDAVF